MQLFRRTKRRNTRIGKIKNLLKEKNFGNKEIKENDDLEHKRFTSTGLKKTLRPNHNYMPNVDELNFFREVYPGSLSQNVSNAAKQNTVITDD